MTGVCELAVAGTIARSVLDAIGTRFDILAVRGTDRTVLMVDGVDQAALRALLVMLWDSGHEVLAMSTVVAGVRTARAGGE